MVSGIASLLLFSMPGGGEWITILLVVVVLFGARKYPSWQEA